LDEGYGVPIVRQTSSFAKFLGNKLGSLYGVPSLGWGLINGSLIILMWMSKT